MTKRVQITLFTQKECADCENARALLRDAGMAFAITYEIDSDRRFADTAIYLSGKVTVPQVFLGTYPIGGVAELAELWQTRRLRDIVQAVNPAVTLDITTLSNDTVAHGVQDYIFAQHIPESEGTQSDDPEQWSILHFYQEFFGFWPNTFLYLHHWPEAYKRFVYCHNMAAIGSAKEVLGIPLLSAIAYSTSHAHGCNYCQVHSVATMGAASMDAVEQMRLARIGNRDADNPFDEYWVSLADLAAMASLNHVPPHYVERLYRLASRSEHAPINVDEQIMAVALVSAAFGFLNVFNDLLGLEIEGGWATAAQERLGLDFGRHAVNTAHNPNNLARDLLRGGFTAQAMMGKYMNEIGNITEYTEGHFGITPSWMDAFPSHLQPLHAALYGEAMRQREQSTLPAEFKHLLAYVAHVEKQHATLAAIEAFIAHYVSSDRPRTIQRLQQVFAVASGRGGNADLFDAAEQSALRLAYLSAQTPLHTPRRFAQPVIEMFDVDTCIEIMVVCGIAGLIQRFAAINPPMDSPVIDAFMAEHSLPTDAQVMRFPLP